MENHPAKSSFIFSSFLCFAFSSPACWTWPSTPFVTPSGVKSHSVLPVTFDHFSGKFLLPVGNFVFQLVAMAQWIGDNAEGWSVDKP